MEAFIVTLGIITVPLHGYLLQPRGDISVIAESKEESWFNSRKSLVATGHEGTFTDEKDAKQVEEYMGSNQWHKFTKGYKETKDHAEHRTGATGNEQMFGLDNVLLNNEEKQKENKDRIETLDREAPEGEVLPFGNADLFSVDSQPVTQAAGDTHLPHATNQTADNKFPLSVHQSVSPAPVQTSEEFGPESLVTHNVSIKHTWVKGVTDSPQPFHEEEKEHAAKAEEMEVQPAGTASTDTVSVLVGRGSQVGYKSTRPHETKNLATDLSKIKKSKVLKKGKTSNQGEFLTKEKKKKEKKIPYFPYFKDDYCPPECACYGRVVQCSDKDIDKIPYGIPYNSRYILLMNNQIDSIPLDLLKEYLSLEFLVLSNNWLTDGSVEAAFEGMLHLKRLFLDRNRLASVPSDLPVSLEELRLDANVVGVMSEVAWSRCPALRLLSLANNSLATGSIPAGVFSPLVSLRTLNLSQNRLVTVPLHLPLHLQELYLRGNRIEEVTGDAFPSGSALLSLDLSANRLTDKSLRKDSFQYARVLESLNLEGNFLRRIPRHLPPALRTLNLESNAISSISKGAFLRTPHLEHLGLSRNRITQVAPGAFRGLAVLHQLDLSHNGLQQVPCHIPPGVLFITLSHNRIRSVPQDAFCAGGRGAAPSSLVRVQLEYNLINVGELDSKAFWCLRGFQVVHF